MIGLRSRAFVANKQFAKLHKDKWKIGYAMRKTDCDYIRALVKVGLVNGPKRDSMYIMTL